MNKLHRLKQFGYLLAGALLILLAAGCERTDDETALRMAVDAMQAAIEARKADTFMQHIADDYQDAQGGDVKTLRRLLLFHFLRNRNISVYITGKKLELLGNLAEVSFNATLTGGENLMPERARIYTVKTRWRKQGGQWIIYHAAWE